jgi:hypothetical protein
MWFRIVYFFSNERAPTIYDGANKKERHARKEGVEEEGSKHALQEEDDGDFGGMARRPIALSLVLGLAQ